MAAITSGTTETSLKGSSLTLARVVWAVLMALTLGMYIYSLSVQVGMLTEGELGLNNFGGWGSTIIWLMLMPLGYIAMALLLVWRRSNDVVAIVASLALGIMGPHLLGGVNGYIATLPSFYIPNLIVSSAGTVVLILLMFIFPTGEIVPRWAKWPMLALIGITVAFELIFTMSEDAGVPPYVFPLVISMVGGLAAQVYRYQRVSTPAQRQQTKWVLLGFVGPILVIIIYFALYQITDTLFDGNTPGSIAAMLGFMVLALMLPASLLIATLRYRLWDIDYVINRTLIYGLMTLVLGAVFAAGFFALRAVLTAVLGSEQAILAAIVPTALVVGLFNPVRRQVRAFVDQRLYGIHVQYATPPGVSLPGEHTERTSLGQYTNLQHIGAGGMADVYKSTHPTLGNAVAVKVLPNRLAKQEEFRKRFQREAQTVAVLRHPHIVQMYDFGESDGIPYMVMQFVDGITLGDYLAQSGRLPLKETLPILANIASALDYAHQQGLVHRDVKPSNVMLESTTNGGHRAVLMDFGIAKIADAASRLTNTGVVGTFDYMAPEQIQAASDVDGRADVYALGVMAYQMLTGESLFKGTNPAALLLAHLNQPAPDPRKLRPDLPADTAHAILRALEKDPSRRFATAGAFAAALEPDDD